MAACAISKHATEPKALGLDGVMLGRAAYQSPATLLEVDARVFGAAAPKRKP
jgi:tRNA-dihydrouridine synthase A